MKNFPHGRFRNIYASRVDVSMKDSSQGEDDAQFGSPGEASHVEAAQFFSVSPPSRSIFSTEIPRPGSKG